MSGDKRVNEAVTQQSSVTVGDKLLQGGERASNLGKGFPQQCGRTPVRSEQKVSFMAKKYIYISGE